ncbi:MAG TPA: ABC transporter permease [Longimicrobiaceae bacterium]|nr:ABC transporter permease [Longimicrobiaceae bacterium]
MNRRLTAAWAAAREGVAIAVDALGANKIRAVLTILGIVVGVATVMIMAGVVTGVRSAVLDGMEVIGPENFILERYDFTNLRLADMQAKPWEHSPSVSVAEADLVAQLPGIQAATPVVTTTLEARGDTTLVQELDLEGLAPGWSDFRRGEFIAGRDLLPGEVAHSASVVVLTDKLARTLLGRDDAVGATVRLAGRPFEVVGIFRAQANVFLDTDYGYAVVPYTTALRYLEADAEWLQVQVVPKPGVKQAEAMDRVTEAIRAARGLRPSQPNDFALAAQDDFKALFDRTTRVFVAVLILLSSVGLAVGGIGVVAIMTISVTERTREVGIRRALGATRADIIWQFLVESATMTLIGGVMGIALASASVFLLAKLSPVPAQIPLWSAAIAVGVITAAGLAFGAYPAARAARMDPVVALRYE